MTFNIINLLNRYDTNGDNKLTLTDFPADSGRQIQKMQKDIQAMPKQTRNFVYSYVFDQNLRQRLNIENMHGLYQTNNLLREEILARWPKSGRMIFNTAEVFSISPLIVVSLLTAEKNFNNKINDSSLKQEEITQRVREIKDIYLLRHKNNLLWALAEYHLANYTKYGRAPVDNWKAMQKNYSYNNLRLVEADDIGLVDKETPGSSHRAGITAVAYISPESDTFKFVNRFIQTLHSYRLSPEVQESFPEWLKDNFINNSLRSWLTILNPLNYYSVIFGFINLRPRPEAVKPLNGIYFEIYKKLAYLGIADSSLRSFTNENLVLEVKNSGLLNIGLFDLTAVRSYCENGDIALIFPESNARKLLAEIDQTIEQIKKTRELIRNIAYLNKIIFREKMERDFSKWIIQESSDFGRPINEIIKINYQNKSLNWQMPRNLINNSYFAFFMGIFAANGYRGRNIDYEISLTDEFKNFLARKYQLVIENYSLTEQISYIKSFLEKINNIPNAEKQIEFSDLVDQNLLNKNEYAYENLFNLLNDFIYESPNHGYPIYSYITSDYGPRKDPLDGSKDFHWGTDIKAFSGTKIPSFSGGEVIRAGWLGNYGNCVIVKVNAEIKLLYAHCSAITVNIGDKIKIGDEIATVGNTGKTTGAHLHVELIINNRSIPLNNREMSFNEAFLDFYSKNWQKYIRR